MHRRKPAVVLSSVAFFLAACSDFTPTTPNGTPDPGEIRQTLSGLALKQETYAEYATTAAARGLRCIIAGAGGAAHLAGVLAAKTILPVLGVPMPSRHLQGLDSLLSIVQMPRGVPVATFAIGEAGAANAGLFAVAMLAVNDRDLAAKLGQFRKAQEEKVLALKLPPVK